MRTSTTEGARAPRVRAQLRSMLPALAVCLVARSAAALVEDPAGAVTVGGSVRNTTALIDQHAVRVPPLGPTAGASYGALRVTAAGDPAPWFGYELHLEQDALLLTEAGSTGTTFALRAPASARYRLLSLSDTWIDDGEVTARFGLERANLRYHLGPVDLILGRQAVTFGKGRFWSPLDVFLPFDALTFDREYKRAIDGVRAAVRLGQTSGFDVVLTPGRVDGARETTRSWYGSAALARAYTTVAGFDLAAQGGKLYGGVQAGGAIAGALGPVELRAEAAYFWATSAASEPVPVPDHATTVLGVGHVWDSSLSLQLEYLYNGAGEDRHLERALPRVAAGRALQLGEHLLGAAASGDLTPILNGSLGAIVSASDGSFALQPGLTYSVADESDFVAGALVAFGSRPRVTATGELHLPSELGAYPNLFYVQYRLYF